ncbi:amidase [Kaistia dalseonensis]|uniref:Amidase n=1 Tax=Kaistia dalseonensis TaxID=410840 RepID=A0ABU0HBF6_9HYPH|nr:amidase [Kaistia dalseonensis]MCX5496692.1 amidase [Kaistia dalseonensis]MDQ0439317.1 amidase [Kaistia dalseonensis]
MADDELWSAPFTTLSPQIQSGALSPIDLTELMMERIARHDAGLHSYITVASDHARERARKADAEIRAGRYRGPLHGIPMAVKDVFYTTEIKTGLGSSIYDDWQAPYESTATQRLNDAGAVMLGKLTATEGVYAQHHPTITEPINPFGAAHWTGNSSSGSGVAVTSGLAYATLGSDTGGSIRLPSSCCGLVGIKPTWGRVSRHGVMALAESLDHVGPMARSARDAAVLLGLIAGADPADPTASPLPVPDYLDGIEDGIVGLTIGIDWAFLRARANDEVLASIEGVVKTLEGLGARFVAVEFPNPDAILYGWHTQCAVEAAIAHRDTFPSRRAEYGPRLAALLDRGAEITGLELGDALKSRRAFNGGVALMFAEIDLFLVPALPVAGPTLEYMASLGPDPDGILAVGPFNAPFDVCGYPTITTPCGATSKGIPMALQLVGKPFAEALLCRAAHAYQSATSWHNRRPTL